MSVTERSEKPPTNDEVGILAREHKVRTDTIWRLVKAGVAKENIEDVIDMRSSLTSYDEGGEIAGQATVTAVVDAYHATSGNLEEFEEIVGNAISAAHRGPDSRGVYLNTHDWNRAVYDSLIEAGKM